MPGSSYPSRNDEMTSMLPNKYLGSGPQPHAGPAGAATPCDRDQQDAASPHPRSFQFEPSDEKTTHAPQKLSRTRAAAGSVSCFFVRRFKLKTSRVRRCRILLI